MKQSEPFDERCLILGGAPFTRAAGGGAEGAGAARLPGSDQCWGGGAGEGLPPAEGRLALRVRKSGRPRRGGAGGAVRKCAAQSATGRHPGHRPHRPNAGQSLPGAAPPQPTGNIASFYGSSCAENGKDALNTPETLRLQARQTKWEKVGESGELDKAVRKGEGQLGVLSAPLPLLAQEDP
eukprot:1188386-Prorocentrum_minimum.AAC.4